MARTIKNVGELVDVLSKAPADASFEIDGDYYGNGDLIIKSYKNGGVEYLIEIRSDVLAYSKYENV